MKVAVKITVPVVLGVTEVAQVEVVALKAARLQALKVPVAVPVLLTATVPPGAEAVPVETSLT